MISTVTTIRWSIRLVGVDLPAFEVETEDEDECPACFAVAAISRAPGVEFEAFGIGAKRVDGDQAERFYITKIVMQIGNDKLNSSAPKMTACRNAENEAEAYAANKWVRRAVAEGRMSSGEEGDKQRLRDLGDS